MNYLADTDACIDFLADRPFAVMQMPAIMRAGAGISIVTIVELYENVYRQPNSRQATQRLDAFVRPFTVLALTREVALRAARVRADLRARNRPIQHRAFDLVVAATALTHGLTLVSSNVRDYSDIPRLRLQTLRPPR